MRYLLKWLNFKILTITCTNKDTEQVDLSYIGDGNEKWESHSGNTFEASYKIKHKLSIQPSILTPGNSS